MQTILLQTAFFLQSCKEFHELWMKWNLSSCRFAKFHVLNLLILVVIFYWYLIFSASNYCKFIFAEVFLIVAIPNEEHSYRNFLDLFQTSFHFGNIYFYFIFRTHLKYYWYRPQLLKFNSMQNISGTADNLQNIKLLEKGRKLGAKKKKHLQLTCALI